MTKWRGIRAKPVAFELTPLAPSLEKRGGEPGFSPFSSQEKGAGGMSSNVRLSEIGHFLALYSNLKSFPVSSNQMWGKISSIFRGKVGFDRLSQRQLPCPEPVEGY